MPKQYKKLCRILGETNQCTIAINIHPKTKAFKTITMIESESTWLVRFDILFFIIVIRYILRCIYCVLHGQIKGLNSFICYSYISHPLCYYMSLSWGRVLITKTAYNYCDITVCCNVILYNAVNWKHIAVYCKLSIGKLICYDHRVVRCSQIAVNFNSADAPVVNLWKLSELLQVNQAYTSHTWFLEITFVGISACMCVSAPGY